MNTNQQILDDEPVTPKHQFPIGGIVCACKDMVIEDGEIVIDARFLKDNKWKNILFTSESEANRISLINKK